MFNLTPRIIEKILFHDLETSLNNYINANSIAISPILDISTVINNVHSCITFSTSRKNFSIFISINNYNSFEEKSIIQYIKGNVKKIEEKLLYLLNKDISVEYEPNNTQFPDASDYKQLIISFISNEMEKYIYIYLPFDFFRLFSKKITGLSSSEIIENELLDYFINSQWMLPNLRSLLSKLNNIELNKLINHLQRTNLLTTYQLFLISQAYPEHSVKLKRVLSKNIIHDIIIVKKNAQKLNIRKRDIIGGIYSIEESIYFLLKNTADFSYSEFLKNIQLIIKAALNREILMMKNFRSWIKEIETNNLLYNTIAITDDDTISYAVSHEADIFLELFNKYISKRKLSDIQIHINPDIVLDSVIQAQIQFVLNYRKLKMKKMNPGHESLEYLLVNFSNKRDYLYLLLSVGWFTLSTAMKGMKRKNTSLVLKNIPVAARYLIEDVLHGIVNPNILHDEIQINKAKRICVAAILQLHDDGMINLED